MYVELCVAGILDGGMLSVGDFVFLTQFMASKYCKLITLGDAFDRHNYKRLLSMSSDVSIEINCSSK